jgi:hypothetical protein
VKFDLGGGTCMIVNGKFPGNGGSKCGVNSSAPISSTITSFGCKKLTSRGLLSMISF